jgi:serine/threonine protein kinase
MGSIKDYQILSKIGEGSYGVVYKAKVDDQHPGGDDDLVAMKKIKLDDQHEGVPITTLREVALLKDLVHDNIVRLRNIILVPPKLFLVFDFLDYDLKQCMDSFAKFENGMPDELIKSCMHQMLSGAPPLPRLCVPHVCAATYR